MERRRPSLTFRVLGSAAGGGFPQWNCGCPNCRDVRAGDARLRPRTQDSVALSADGERWLLVNASPDVHRQIEATPALHPRAARHSPVAAIALTNGDLDHVLGLFSLRESQPLAIYATGAVREGLTSRNAMTRTLERFEGQSVWRPLELGREGDVLAADGTPLGLTITPFAARGKSPVHLVGLAPPGEENNVGLRVREPTTGRSVVIMTASATADGVASLFDDADCLLFDGTFWSSDELSRDGLSKARAEDMAHVTIGGPSGSLEASSGWRVGRKIYTHINNTNPILREGSPERRAVEEAGWGIATDGLEVTL